MIKSFETIGDYLLKGIDLSKDLSIDEKERILKLNSYNIKTEDIKYIFDKNTKQNVKNVTELYPLIVNFDTNRNIVELKIGNNNDYIKSIINLNKKSPNGSKISFYSNNISDIICKAIPDLVKEIEKDKDNLSKYTGIYDFLINIKRIFFDDNNDIYINKIYIKNYSNDDNNDIGINKINIKNDSNIEIKKLLVKYKKENNISNLIYITIDDKDILNTKYRSDYINIIFDFYFADLYNIDKQIIKYNFPMKFFNTDKQEFAFNVQNNSFNKSFPLSFSKYMKINVGMNYILNQQQKYSFLGFNYMILPYFLDKYNSKEFKIIKTTLDSELKKGNFNKKLENLVDIKNYENIYFSMIFYDSSNSEFKVLKDIPDISVFELENINDILYQVNEQVYGEINDILKLKYFNFSTFDKLFLFDINKKNISKKIKVILELLYNIYSKNLIQKELIYNLFFVNLKRMFYSDNISDFNLSEQIINLNKLFLILKYNKNIDEVDKIMDNYSLIKESNLLDFFDRAKVINKYKQGLIVMGFLINQIIYAQNKKTNNSSRSKTFIKKVGFDGLTKQDVTELYIEIIEYSEIYKLDYNNSEKVFVGEIINSLESSDLLPFEINYYILLGVELGKYIGIKESQNKKSNINLEGD